MLNEGSVWKTGFRGV